jgi:hypothetical protein
MWQPTHVSDPGAWTETFETLPANTVFMTWMDSSAAVQAFAAAGHQVVVCAPFYIDQLLPGGGGNAAGGRPTPQVLVDRWRAVFEVDIMEGVEARLASNVLGAKRIGWCLCVDPCFRIRTKLR